MPLAVELERSLASAIGPGSACSRTSSSGSARASSSPSPGRTAAGKTTLVRIVLGLERPARGHGALFGEPAHRFSRRRMLGYLAQRSALGGDAPATVREVVSAGRLAAGGLLGPLRRRDRELVAEAIERVGLRDVADVAAAHALGRDAAAGVHREGARGRARAPRPRRAHDRRRRRVAGVARRAARPSSTPSSASRSCTSRTSSGPSSSFVQRLVLVRRTIVFDGPPGELPGMWHDPSHTHARDSSSCAWRSGPAPSSASSRPRSGSSSSSAASRSIGDGIGHVAFAGVAAGILLDVSPVLTALVAAVAGGVGDRAPALPRRHGRRPGARARLLHGDRARRRARLGGRRARRRPLPVPVRLDPHRHARRPRGRSRRSAPSGSRRSGCSTARWRASRSTRRERGSPACRSARSTSPSRRSPRSTVALVDARRRHPPRRRAHGAAGERRGPDRVEHAARRSSSPWRSGSARRSPASRSRTTPTSARGDDRPRRGRRVRRDVGRWAWAARRAEVRPPRRERRVHAGLVASAAARLVLLGRADEHGLARVRRRAPVDEPLRRRGRAAAAVADGLELVDELGVGEELGHRAEREPPEVLVEPGRDDPGARASRGRAPPGRSAGRRTGPRRCRRPRSRSSARAAPVATEETGTARMRAPAWLTTSASS